LRSDAVERAIYKDIPQTFGVSEPMLLERLLYTLGGQIGGIYSAQNLSQTLGGLSQPTLDRYTSLLERAFLIFTLQNYSGSEEAKQRRGLSSSSSIRP
jgi:predicted AAA+ superfamily ATPase